MIELVENNLLKQRHEERVLQLERERLARLVQSQQPSRALWLRLSVLDRLLHLGRGRSPDQSGAVVTVNDSC